MVQELRETVTVEEGGVVRLLAIAGIVGTRVHVVVRYDRRGTPAAAGEEGKAKKSWLDFAGVIHDPRGSNNEQIDEDLAREYLGDRADDEPHVR